MGLASSRNTRGASEAETVRRFPTQSEAVEVMLVPKDAEVKEDLLGVSMPGSVWEVSAGRSTGLQGGDGGRGDGGGSETMVVAMIGFSSGLSSQLALCTVIECNQSDTSRQSKDHNHANESSGGG